MKKPRSHKKKPTRAEATAWGGRLIDDTYEKLHVLIDAQHRAIERRDALLADHEKLWKAVHDALHHLTEVWRYLARHGLVETAMIPERSKRWHAPKHDGMPKRAHGPKNGNRRRTNRTP